MAVQRRMPCLEGRSHRWDAPRGTCKTCRESWELVRTYCGPWACDDLDQRIDERMVAVAPSMPEWRAGVGVRYELRQDLGACDWCIEKHQREDRERERYSHYLVDTYWPETARYFSRAAERKEREQRWQLESRQRQETDRQRRLLRQGHQTLIAMRRLLRHEVDPLPRPVSEPARTSQT
jgi:hypothetical protein